MIIKDLFAKPIDRSIQGVVTIGNEDEEQRWMELEEYVCTREIENSFRTFFRRYRESIQTPTEKIGVWITGFFGSGKSHFLKILGYILGDEEVAGWRPVKYFEEKLKDEMVLADMRTSAGVKNKVVLFNIDSKAKSDSKSKTQAIMDIMLRAFNEAIGYCGSNPWVADMERILDDEGLLEEFAAKFEELSRRGWFETRSKAMLNRDYIIKTLVAVRNMSEDSARQFVDDQIKNYTNSTEDFAKLVNEYCKKNKTRIIFLMDEVGQFIGDNTQLMLNLQTCVEDLGKYCRGQAWVVVTSQQQLQAMIESTQDRQQDFSKIQGRFDTRILLSGANADEVIKKRILAKKEQAETPLKSLYETYSSKLSNLILFPGKPSWSGYKDSEEFKDVYPFVSYQFELLQKVFESIREHGMSEGKHLSQNERSLLSAFQDSAKAFSDQSTGVLIPFDSFYSTIEQFIDYDIKTVFTNAQRRTSLDPFAYRVLRILFMIKHVKEMPATVDRLATMMVSSVDEDKAALKEKIFKALQQLEQETLIQKNGEEYDFLTNAEQDVNRQINNIGYSETDVQKAIYDIVFDRIMESNKYRFENRYDFGLNRYVDTYCKGSINQEYIGIKIVTHFTGIKGSALFGAESIQSKAVVVDLTEGLFIDELIRANKIEIFKRNNSTTMSAALAEIMSKKSAEFSDRMLRAEEMIRKQLREAPIYLSGTALDIKAKEARDRLQDALKEIVRQDFFKLPLVQAFYPDQKAVLLLLNDNNVSFDDDLTNEANYGAYEEIIDRIKHGQILGKNMTVKSLLDTFTKKPYGWRDIDILGMLGVLWKRRKIQIMIHGTIVEENNGAFKNDFAHKSNVDTMVVRVKEEISSETLYEVKRIMNRVFSENLPLDEAKLKDGVISFFERKLKFLSSLKTKYGSDYAGSKAAREIAGLFEEIIRSKDALTIFKAIIEKKEELENSAEPLEQLESFYKEGSSQHQNYQDAMEIIEWYGQNQILEDLSSMDDVVKRMDEIVSMDMPFSRMSDLAKLVFSAGQIKDRILDEKLQKALKALNDDLDAIRKEAKEALAKTDDAGKRSGVEEKAEEVEKQYAKWFEALNKDTPNIDSYVTASANTLKGFKQFLEKILRSGGKAVRSKRVSVIECIPVANKKVTSAADIEKVVDAIRSKLAEELKNNDELNLD